MPKKRHLSLNQGQYGGFILSFEPARTESFYQILMQYGHASESFSAEDWSFENCELIFLARREPSVELLGAALMRKTSGSGGTRRVKMRVFEPVLFENPISSSEAMNGTELSNHISTAENIKRIDPVVWENFISLVVKLRPDEAESIRALQARRIEDRRILSDDKKSVRIAEQRDAIGLVLEIAEIDRRPVLAGLKSNQITSARSVLDILDSQPIAERSIIEHDSRIFGETLQLNNENMSSRFVSTSGKEVRIYVTDSTPLETATGVDLLIYNDIFRSFLLLQYKAMERDIGVKGWSYKVDGSNLEQQLDAMERLQQAIPQQNLAVDIYDQRLNDSPFYFKFCERTRLSAREDSLAAGLTIGSTHLQAFLTTDLASIEGQGRRFGYSNASRYLSNSEFISLARQGWIGTRVMASQFLAEVIAARKEGKSKILAIIDNGVKTHQREPRSITLTE